MEKSLVIMHDQQAVTTSLKIAEVFNKQHKDVLEAINTKIDSAEFSAQYKTMFARGEYKDRSGKRNVMYYLTRKGFVFIAMGFTGREADRFKLAYIDAFDEMESQQANLPRTPEERLQLTMEVADRTARKVKRLDARVVDLEQNAPLAPGEYNYISKHINRAVYEYLDVHRYSHDYRKLFFKDINRGLNELLGIRTRSQMRSKHFDKACEFIANWMPSTVTVMQVNSQQTALPGMEVK